MYVQRLLYILKSSPQHSEYSILLSLLPLLRVSTVVHRFRHLLVCADCTPSSSSGTTLLPDCLVLTSHILPLFAMEFIRRGKIYNEKHPKNNMVCFPTVEGWTLTSKPDRVPTEERYPSHYAVNSLPMMNINRKTHTKGKKAIQSRPIMAKTLQGKDQHTINPSITISAVCKIRAKVRKPHRRRVNSKMRMTMRDALTILKKMT